MKGYKVFNSDWTCIGFQYEVGKTYEMDEKPRICDKGFHFCKKLIDCFFYYPFDYTRTKIAEVEALGDIKGYNSDETSKCCTNKIRIIREIPFSNLEYRTNYKEIDFSSNTTPSTISDDACFIYMTHDAEYPILGGVGRILNYTMDYYGSSLLLNNSYIMDRTLYPIHHYRIGYNRIVDLKEVGNGIQR